MRIAFPNAVVIATAGCVALAGCADGITVTDHKVTGTESCPNLDPVAQQYMQGSARVPVRCGPQKLNYWDPEITITGKRRPAG